MGVVYMICCLTTGEIYYGSTKVDWKTRLRRHRHKLNRTSSKQIIARGNYEFIVLEEVDDNQLLIRERYYIDTFPCINKQRPFITNEESKTYHQRWSKTYYETHKATMIIQQSEYQAQHKEEIKQRASKPFECECGSTVRWDVKSKHLQTKKHLAYQRSLAI